MIGRRALLRRLATAAAVSASGGLSGCGAWWRAPVPLIRPPELRVAAPGFPAKTGSAMVAALGHAAGAYEAARRGTLRLSATSTLFPSSTWFYCGPHPTSLCAPGAELTNLMFGGLSQVHAADGLPFEVSGRTALGVRYGSEALPVPQPTLSPQTLPDLILAYDVWCYWLGVLGSPVTAAWKLHSGDTEGLPTAFGPRGVPMPGTGLTTPAIPLLRNPVVIGAVSVPVAPWREAASATWTWQDVEELVTRTKGTQPTFPFSVNAYFPGATESALAMAVESGATFGGPLDTGAAGRVADTLATLHGIVQDGAVNPMVAAVGPGYLWAPLSVAPNWGPTGVALPYPAGTRSRAVPCTYLCATVNPQSPHAAVAEDFAFFLLSTQGQEVLSAAQVGLPLRVDQAVAQMSRYMPYVADAGTVASADDDLSAEQVAGGPIAGAAAVTAYYAAIDAFAAQAQASGEAPG